MIVEVRPLDKERWHKKTGKDSFQRPKAIEALYDDRVGGYATGLTEEEEKEYGRKLGVDLNNRFDPLEPHPVWTSKQFTVVLPNHTIFFDDKKAIDYVKIKMLKASKFVANSVKEDDNGLWPEATHVIFDEKEEVEAKAAKVEVKNQIMAKLNETPQEEKLALVWLLSNKSLRGKSPSFITVELDELITDDPIKVWETMNLSKAQKMSKATILEAIDRQLLTKEGTNVLWMGEMIANDVDEAARWLMNPDNQGIKARILEKLNS